jgi:superfamily II DNA or RNA helicase
MSPFKELLLKEQYDTSIEDVINEFYRPVLEKAVSFDRAAGFFSPEVLLNSLDSLKIFIRNNGKMRFIISPLLRNNELLEIQEALNNSEIALVLFEKHFLNAIEESESNFRAAQLFVALQEKGFMEVLIALPRSERGLFHQKISIYFDGEEHIVSNGSNNETLAAYTHNIESFDVFRSWIEPNRVNLHIQRFNQKWAGLDPNVKVVNFIQALSSNLLKKLKTDQSIDELIDITNDIRKLRIEKKPRLILNFDPYDYQKRAAETWLEVQKGILKFATGSGKTKTAIYSIAELYFQKGSLFVVVLVPDKTLSYQWALEFADIRIKPIVCNSDNNWRNSLNEKVNFYKQNINDLYVAIVTNDTFFGDKFKSIMGRLSDYIFIVDECHSVTQKNYQQNMPKASYRLGLSATPESDFDEQRTIVTLDYFNGIIAEYSLIDAIQDQKLTPYNYFPVEVRLNEEEIESYVSLTKKISVLFGKEQPTPEEIAIRETLLYARSRILYNAESKLKALRNLISYNPDVLNHLIIYCGASTIKEEGNLSQLESVNQLLGNLNIPHAQYTGEENTYERDIGIKEFRRGTYNSLTAIKCLDEGVDIPEIQNAVIMASSQNTREFVQRRGRLLRRSPGKKVATIYDFIIVSDDERLESATLSEMRRALEYASIALNRDDTYKRYESLYLELKEKKDREQRKD